MGRRIEEGRKEIVPINKMTKDEELKLVLDKIDWKCYIEYGTVRIKIRDGRKQMVFIERTYPD